MTTEQEVRSFVMKYVPNGEMYLRETPVPPFGNATWDDVFTHRVQVPEKTQRQVLKRLRDLFGNREPVGRY